MTYTLICWGWLIVSLALLTLTLVKLRNGLVQWFLVGGLLLNAAAGFCNGLVMTANGAHMPAEKIGDWDAAPAFLDGESAQRSCFCALLFKVNRAVAPQPSDNVHFEVPSPQIVSPRDAGTPSARPWFAVLDDRHPVRICGNRTVFSKGDMFGCLGVLLILAGLTWSVSRFILRKLFRRTKNAPTGK